MVGFGAFTDLLAAPFDNYWHELYGIDITLWSPFHLMGSVGAILAAIGLVFAFASEEIIDRRSERLPKTMFKLTALEWGALIMLGALQRLALTSLAQFHSLSIGPVEFLTYPLPLVLNVGMSAVSTLWFTGRSGTATLLGLLTCLHTFLTEAFVPWSLRLLVTHYRFSNRPPFFNAPATLFSLIFVA